MDNINKYTIRIANETFDFYEYIEGELQCAYLSIPKCETPEAYLGWFKWLNDEVSEILYIDTIRMILNPFDCSWSIWGKKKQKMDDGGVYALI